MNKDVIYIEPEDDITDIITKIEKSKEKIVALVPPKKAGVFRSIVNIKLIAKAGATSDKRVVLVSVDPSIVRLAAATRLPVAKNLQSAPEIPKIEAESEQKEEQTIEDMSEDENVEEQSGDGSNGSKKSDGSHRKSEKSNSDDNEEEEYEDDEEEDNEDEEDDKKKRKDEKEKKSGKKGNKILDWIKSHKKTSIFLGIFALGLIGFLIWALVFAPAVDISVAIKTDSKNFSENVTFTKTATEENAKEGKFYLQEKKLEETQEVNFEATGEKNQGNKASGEVTVIATVSDKGGTTVINTGDTFSINGLSYTADNSVTMHYNGDDMSVCKNKDATATEFKAQGCRIYANVKVTATQAGAKYNIAASSNGWSTVASVEVYSNSAISGGTDDVKTVVQQSDIEKAKSELTTAKEEENKKKLYASIGDEYYIVESSFTQSTSAAEATPGADQEVGSSKPVLKATTTSTVYVIEKSKLEEFIAEKASLEDGQKIYETKDTYVENFTEGKSSITGRLKTQYYIGPKITESEVVEKIKGKGLGDAQREIRDFYGVSNVTIDSSYPWVMTIPSDSNKVNVHFEVKDKDGNEVKDQSNSEKGDSSSSSSSDNSNNNKSGN